MLFNLVDFFLFLTAKMKISLEAPREETKNGILDWIKKNSLKFSARLVQKRELSINGLRVELIFFYLSISFCFAHFGKINLIVQNMHRSN